MFRPGERVVYPAQGVGVIERLQQQEIGGARCEFYIVRILTNNVTLMVPVHNAEHVGLRHLTTADYANTILERLKAGVEGSVSTGQNWNRRFREYSEKLKSRDPADVAMVMRELMLISRFKELSFGERRLLEQASALVAGEIAQVLSLSEVELREAIFSWYALPQPAVDS